MTMQLAKDINPDLLAQFDNDLPRNYSLILYLAKEGRSYSQMADMLDRPKGTIKSRLHRARAALRKLAGLPAAPTRKEMQDARLRRQRNHLKEAADQADTPEAQVSQEVAPAKDPGRTPAEIATRKAEDLIESISDATLKQMTDFRTEIDGHMRAVTVRRAELLESIGTFAQDCTHTIKAFEIMQDGMRQLRETFPAVREG